MENLLIYLYVKESPLGLKYLGQTLKKDPFTYLGSGKYWKRHLKFHNFTHIDIKTTILLATTDREELQKMSVYYSLLWDIVKNENWANLMPENGTKSSLGYKHTTNSLEKMKLAKLGKKQSPEHIKKIHEPRKGKKRTPFSLEWKENMSKVRKQPIVQLSLTGEFIKNWDSQIDAEKVLGVHQGNIGETINNKRGRKQAGGFKWMKLEEYLKLNKL